MVDSVQLLAKVIFWHIVAIVLLGLLILSLGQPMHLLLVPIVIIVVWRITREKKLPK